MNPDALRDAILAAIVSALLFTGIRSLTHRSLKPDERRASDTFADMGTVAVVVFLVVFTLPMWQLGKDEVLPPPFMPAPFP